MKSWGFEEKKHWYHEKCTEKNFLMSKGVDIGTDDWSKGKR